MKKNIDVYLKHILNATQLIEKYSENKSESDFLNSTQLQDSILRRIEIIGEAMKNIPIEFRKRYNIIPWKEFTGMRDILIHQYFGIDLELTWQVIKKDIPNLKKLIQSILKDVK